MIPCGASAAGDWRTLHEVWNPSPAPAEFVPPAVRLFCQDSRLVFEIDAPGPARADEWYAPPGMAGDLWRSDCGEFFLAAPGRGRYIEVNLGPRGAWWAGLFGGPRIRCAMPEIPQAELAVHSGAIRNGNRWRGTWSASMAALTNWLEPESGGQCASLAANATCVVGDGNSRRFFTRCALPDGGPDFHRPPCWPAFDPQSGLL